MAKPNRILIINGHSGSANSLSHSLANAYYEGAVANGAEVDMLNLAELQFAPVLHGGYDRSQPMEPDLVRSQTLIAKAEHLVFVYPNWWGAQPALLKGFIDRTFLPGFAFRYKGRDSLMWDKLLKGKTARLLVTMDTPPWYYRWVYRAPGHRLMRHNILGFCGIGPVEATDFGPVKLASEKIIGKWILQARKLGEQRR
jgi:NAD(P)H dehydrogenase (quinone)